MAAHSSVLAWRIPMGRGAWWATVHGVTESDTTEHSKHTSASHWTTGPPRASVPSVGEPRRLGRLPGGGCLAFSHLSRFCKRAYSFGRV